MTLLFVALVLFIMIKTVWHPEYLGKTSKEYQLCYSTPMVSHVQFYYEYVSSIDFNGVL